MQKLSQRESDRLSISAAGSAPTGVLLSHPNISAAPASAREALLKEVKALPFNAAVEQEQFAGALADLADTLPVSVLASEPLVKGLYDCWHRHIAPFGGHALALQVFKLNLRLFCFSREIKSLLALFSAHPEAAEVMLYVLETAGSLTGKGQLVLALFLQEAARNIDLYGLSPETIGLLVKGWIKFFWKRKSQMADHPEKYGMAVRNSFFKNLIELLGWLQKVGKMPAHFLQYLLGELAETSAYEWCFETANKSLSLFIRYRAAICRFYKLGLRKNSGFTDEELFSFVFAMVSGYHARSGVKSWVLRYGPYKIMTYLPAFCLKEHLFQHAAHVDYIVHLLEGKNIRRMQGLRWPLSKKGAHIFHSELPVTVESFEEGVTHAFLLQCGFTADEAEMFTRVLNGHSFLCSLSGNWVTVTDEPAHVLEFARFFTKNREQMNHRRKLWYLMCLRSLKAENPDFSLKGMTLRAFEAVVERKSKKKNYGSWKGLALPDHEMEYKGRQFKFVQIKDHWALQEEGDAMRHCVGSYTSMCKNGTTAIWSLREILEDGREKSKVTISIDIRIRRITEARGKCNTSPDPVCRSLLNTWRKENDIR